MRNDSNVFRKREVLDVIREKQSTANDDHTHEIVVRAKAAHLRPSREQLSPEDLRLLAGLSGVSGTFGAVAGNSSESCATPGEL